MKIVMFLESSLIDSIGIEKQKITQPGYLSSYIRRLKEKHVLLIEQATDEPEFLLERLQENTRPQEE